MYALVDCNNFYVSCERVFQPQLNGRPVIVLSNNDGCAIARSEEAKALGIEMADPLHFIKDIVAKHQVKVFSSNYTLYGDMSNRVYSIYNDYAAHIENSSIDEAFLFLGDMPFHSLNRIAITLRQKIKQWTGIPVSIGLAPTKTLAKMANRYAKKMHREEGIYSLDTEEKIKDLLRWCPIEDVWGIGHQYAAKLKDYGLITAYDFTQFSEEWIRKNMTVVGQRMYNELRSIPSIKFEEVSPAKKGICTSRQFGKLLTDKEQIKEAVANHAAACAFKLRKQDSCAGLLEVFLLTNEHRKQDLQFAKKIIMHLPRATNHTNLIIHYTMKAVDMLYKRGYNFYKGGVEVKDIVPASQVQGALWDEHGKPVSKALTKAMDGVNGHMGAQTVRIARQGYSKAWEKRNDYLSKCYTTRLEHVLRVGD